VQNKGVKNALRARGPAISFYIGEPLKPNAEIEEGLVMLTGPSFVWNDGDLRSARRLEFLSAQQPNNIRSLGIHHGDAQNVERPSLIYKERDRNRLGIDFSRAVIANERRRGVQIRL
jgi:hypothetical protein